MKKKMISLLLIVSCLFSILPVFAVPTLAVNGERNSGSTQLSKLSKEEIMQLLKQNPKTWPEDVFQEQPSCSAPYKPGALKKEVLQAVMNRLNALRRIGGLPPVKLDQEFCNQGQYGAVLLSHAGELSYHLAQPKDMDDDFYQKARDGLGGYICAGQTPMDVVDHYMNYSDQFTPCLDKVGFGFATSDTGYKTYVTEARTNRDRPGFDYDFISWPASGQFPVDLIHGDTVWNIALNPDHYQTVAQSDISVILTREYDGKQWTFSGNGYTKSESGPYFEVSQNRDGFSNCIMFRPDGVPGYEGIYTVSVKGVKTSTGQAVQDFTYSVDFFNTRPALDTGKERNSGSIELSKLSKEEIAQLLRDNPLTFSGNIFQEEPSCSAPYAPGSVTNEALQAATNRLNALRQIAGLPSVKLDQSFCEQAQYGAVLLAHLNVLSHTPEKPSDMDDDFYQKAYAATSSSNLYQGKTLTEAVDGFMYDTDVSNLEDLGHRRWQLNPNMGKVGFGLATNWAANPFWGIYVAEKAVDRSGAGCDYDFISWPASGNFPSDLLDRNDGYTSDIAWSIQLNPDRYQAPKQSDLSITLTRESDGKQWTFSGNNYVKSNSGMYFHVSQQSYGYSNCIIFRPDGIQDYEGVYTVSVQGLKTFSGQPVQSFTYAVDFFQTDSVNPSAAQVAYASTQNVDVDGTPIVFQMYALKDANGNMTNYVKVRDVAQVLNGTQAQFSVGWNGAVNLTRGESYTSNGSEMSTPFSGDRTYTLPTSPTNVGGVRASLDAIVLTDDAGGGYTYYKLRDLGKALGFNVSWSTERGVYIESNRPYTGS